MKAIKFIPKRIVKKNSNCYYAIYDQHLCAELIDGKNVYKFTFGELTDEDIKILKTGDFDKVNELFTIASIKTKF